jgi:hypothetical protein
MAKPLREPADHATVDATEAALADLSATCFAAFVALKTRQSQRTPHTEITTPAGQAGVDRIGGGDHGASTSHS